MIAAAEWTFTGQSMLDEAGNEEWGLRGGERLAPTGLFLAITSVVIRKMGWVSRGEAFESDGEKTATAGIAWDVAVRPNDTQTKKMIEKYDLHAEERDGKLADAALAWARALPTTEVDYLYNLGVQTRRQAIDYKATGMVASAIAAYQRHLEKARQAKPKGNHVGTVGVRAGFAGLKVQGTRSFDSDFGVRTLVRFQDAAGNVLVWWTGEPPDWIEEGATVDVTATVKGHDDYHGTPQTTLSRVALGLPKVKGKKGQPA